jgi:putative ABC transport system permease protein
MARTSTVPLAHPESFFIGGSWVAPSSDSSIDVIDAGTEELAFTIAEAQAADMARAVGMTRRQLRRSVRWESVIIAAIGGSVGLALGLVWAWAFTSALETEDLFRLSVPLGRIALLAVLSLVAGAIAAVIPAWRASRLEIFDAIARE